jgi:hypothetical protein
LARNRHNAAADKSGVFTGCALVFFCKAVFHFLKIKIVSKMHRKATIPKKAHAKISVLSFHVPE